VDERLDDEVELPVGVGGGVMVLVTVDDKLLENEKLEEGVALGVGVGGGVTVALSVAVTDLEADGDSDDVEVIVPRVKLTV
jgi:hypothetical protein